MINGFKEYFISHNEVVYDNPSPGNKQGGITTLEDKCCGCVQKGGTAPIMDVIGYGDAVTTKGLNMLYGPGNDLVSATAMTAAGAHLILFSTGRGTPFSAPAPTPEDRHQHPAGHQEVRLDRLQHRRHRRRRERPSTSPHRGSSGTGDSRGQRRADQGREARLPWDLHLQGRRCFVNHSLRHPFGMPPPSWREALAYPNAEKGSPFRGSCPAEARQREYHQGGRTL